MYRTILVPLDGSRRAEAILPHVESLVQRYDAEVVFLQVIEPPPLMVTPGHPELALYHQTLERETDAAKSYLKQIVGEFQRKGIAAREELEQGPVVAAIIDAATRLNADLIALASHGRGGLAQVFYGSVASGVLQRIDRPLLLIRSRADE
jgi:nucleotide-binding universal stress UspA family protein